MDAQHISELGTILSIWAHPDDETYLSGGLMAAAAANGQRVVCVTATAGERGTSSPELWPPERLGAVRRLEAGAAMAVLGVAEHHVMGLPDGSLASHGDVGRELVGRLLDEVRPDTVLTFGPHGMTCHPDHVAVHRWVRSAWEARGRPGRLLEAAWTSDQLARFGAALEENGSFMGDVRPVGLPADWLAVHLTLRGTELDRKLVALRAMATQIEPARQTLGEDVFVTQVAEECFVEVLDPSRPDLAGGTAAGVLRGRR